MVTQLYTAPLKPYNAAHAQKGVGAPLGQAKSSELTTNPDDDGSQNGSHTLAALQDQSQNGVINIQAVLVDFQSTMDALGVTPEVRQEVAPYLQVVAHQAQRPQPVAGLVKQNLRIAGDTLDQFISETLGQPSNVVREWVDALLLQPINFKSDTPIVIHTGVEAGMAAPMAPASGPIQDHGAASSDSLDTGSSELADVDQRFIKQALQDAKLAMKENRLDDAMGKYQGILDKLDGQDYPLVKGRVLYQMGRVQEKGRNLEGAVDYYQNALDTLPEKAALELRGKVCRAYGQVLQQQGNIDQAITIFQQGIGIQAALGNAAEQGQMRNLLGMVYMRQGQVEQAQTQFESALVLAQESDPAMVTDVLSNLGSLSRKAGRYAKAMGYYKQSYEAASARQDVDGMRQTLQTMASLYLDTGKPEKAYKILEKALFKV